MAGERGPKDEPSFDTQALLGVSDAELHETRGRRAPRRSPKGLIAAAVGGVLVVTVGLVLATRGGPEVVKLGPPDASASPQAASALPSATPTPSREWSTRIGGARARSAREPASRGGAGGRDRADPRAAHDARSGGTWARGARQQGLAGLGASDRARRCRSRHGAAGQADGRSARGRRRPRGRARGLCRGVRGRSWELVHALGRAVGRRAVAARATRVGRAMRSVRPAASARRRGASRWRGRRRAARRSRPSSRRAIWPPRRAAAVPRSTSATAVAPRRG
jgi:hypothetical protein